MKLAIKVLLFTLLLPGTFSVYIPNWLLRPEGLAKMLQASGVSLLGWAASCRRCDTLFQMCMGLRRHRRRNARADRSAEEARGQGAISLRAKSHVYWCSVGLYC